MPLQTLTTAVDYRLITKIQMLVSSRYFTRRSPRELWPSPFFFPESQTSDVCIVSKYRREVDTLPVLVFDPSYQAPAERVRPPIRDEDRPKDVQRTLTKASVTGRLNEIERLYQEWFLTDEFTNRELAGIEARLIQ